MDYSTSSASGGHASERAGEPVFSARGFLDHSEVRAAFRGIAQLQAPGLLPSPSPLAGAEYVAFLEGPQPSKALLPTMNAYRDTHTRWVELASGPLAEAIDSGVLTVCPTCRFLNYSAVPCQVCACMLDVTQEDAERFADRFIEDGITHSHLLERHVNDWRMGRALDLFDGPDDAALCAEAVSAIRILNNRERNTA